MLVQWQGTVAVMFQREKSCVRIFVQAFIFVFFAGFLALRGWPQAAAPKIAAHSYRAPCYWMQGRGQVGTSPPWLIATLLPALIQHSQCAVTARLNNPIGAMLRPCPAEAMTSTSCMCDDILMTITYCMWLLYHFTWHFINSIVLFYW